RGYADSLNKPILWILGMLGNKNYQEILQLLLKPNDALYLVPVPDHLTAEPEELAIAAQKICSDLTEIQRFPELTLALNEAVTDKNEKYTLILGGSLYLIGHFLSLK
ncbi:MAG: bifunctional folylpolyglutamate synthase/dihydrofolate synthase, partial [Microcystaceae cyanobacterium]